MAEVMLATEADIEALAALRHEWSGASRGSAASFVEPFREWFHAEASRRTFWIARVEGRAVGMVNLMVLDRMPKPEMDSGAWGYLSNMYVQGPHRNQGVGSLLIDALLAYSDHLGLSRVVLNPSARSVPLYRRQGFRPAGDLLLRNGRPK